MAGNQIREVVQNFFNIRGTFKLAHIIKLGTHMSMIRLQSGKFLVLDTVALNPALKEEIDLLTNKGQEIEAVVATHPFHTLYFLGFYKEYPNVPYYGTPRHIRTIKDIPWAGSVIDCAVRTKWHPEIDMRIPAGAEFIAPMPEKSNHFSGMFVFHAASRVIHIDDTVNVVEEPGLLLKMFGFRDGDMMFHPTIKGHGLYPTHEAPYQFKAFIEGILHDWDFDSICAAHIGNKIGGAKQGLQYTLDKAEPLFKKLSEKNKKHDANQEPPKDPNSMNVEGNECG